MMPIVLPVRMGAHVTDAVPPDLSGKHRAKSVPPEPNGLLAHVDAKLMDQVFNVPKRKREAHVQHDRQANDLGAGSEIPKWAAFCHLARLCNRPARLN
jgi:hypothetical protein